MRPEYSRTNALQRKALSRLSSGNVIQMCFPAVYLNGDKVGQTHECAHVQTHARPITEGISLSLSELDKQYAKQNSIL